MVSGRRPKIKSRERRIAEPPAFPTIPETDETGGVGGRAEPDPEWRWSGLGVRLGEKVVPECTFSPNLLHPPRPAPRPAPTGCWTVSGNELGSRGTRRPNKCAIDCARLPTYFPGRGRVPWNWTGFAPKTAKSAGFGTRPGPPWRSSAPPGKSGWRSNPVESPT